MSIHDQTEGDSEVIQKGMPCDAPGCGSSDAKAYYSDGHSFCFSCRTHKRNDTIDGTSVAEDDDVDERPTGDVYSILPRNAFIDEIPSRKLTLATAKKWRYYRGTTKVDGIETPAQFALYIDAHNNPAFAKVRFQDKTFSVYGQKAQRLYGQNLWSKGGKMLVITEGEIDAMSVSQVQNHKYPVVSIPFGAQSAAKAIKAQYEWVTSFDKVILWFDNDQAGQEAAQEVAEVLPIGKTFIVRGDLKDASEYLKDGRETEMVNLVWRAEEFRPEGILNVANVKARALAPKVIGLPWKDDRLTKLTFGRRYGEAYALGAGSGVGKTDYLMDQIAYDIDVLDQKVGLFLFEQEPVETVERVAGKIKGKQFHLPPGDGNYTDDEKLATIDEMEAKDNLFVFDHFGMADYERVEKNIRFMAKTQGIRIFYLDHLTALASGRDERVKLEEIMGAIGGLVKELKIILIFVSHLSTPDGLSHEEGGQVLPKHFKGSRAIIYWSSFMFGIERNTQAEDKTERQTARFRVVKDRWTGRASGAVLYFGYDETEGRLVPTEYPGDTADQSRFGAVKDF